MALPCCHLTLCHLYPLWCDGRDLLHLDTCRQASGTPYHIFRPSFRKGTTQNSWFPEALHPMILGPREPLSDEKYFQDSSACLGLYCVISMFFSQYPWHNAFCIETYPQEHGSEKLIEILARQREASTTSRAMVGHMQSHKLQKNLSEEIAAPDYITQGWRARRKDEAQWCIMSRETDISTRRLWKCFRRSHFSWQCIPRRWIWS